MGLFPWQFGNFSQTANQEPRDLEGVVLDHWGAAPPGKWEFRRAVFPHFSLSNYKVQSSFHCRLPGGESGGQSAVRGRRAAEEEEAVIGWFGPVLRASVD